jgi:hypothetical protein
MAACRRWKWFYISKRRSTETYSPKEIGFRSARNVMNSNVTFISRFEPGHQDMIAFGTLQQAILKVCELGWKKVSGPVKDLSKIAKAAFEIRGLLTAVVCSRKNHSSIINIK